MVEGSVDVKVVKDAVNKICNLMVEIEASNDGIKTILSDCNEKTGVDKADLKRVAKIYYKNSIDAEKAKANEFFDFYEALNLSK